MPSIRSALIPSQIPFLKGKIQIASILRMSSPDFERWISEMENSPLFQKLFQFSSELKIIHRRTFTRATLSKQFYELQEAQEMPAGGGNADIQQLLESKSSLIESIRKIGQENFERYFLYADGDYTQLQVAESCGIKKGEVVQIFELLNKVSIQSEFNMSSLKPQSQEIYYTKVAQIMRDQKNGFSVAFLSPRMVQGVYQINYKKLQEIRKKNILNQEEKKTLRFLLSRINLINSRKDSLYQLLLGIIKFQSEFFEEEVRDRIKPLTQQKMAAEIRVSTSSVCRLIYGRSIETPGGNDMPLTYFFCSRKEWLKRRFDIIQDQKSDLTDNQIRDIIKKMYGISLSRRSVNQYRREIQKKGGTSAGDRGQNLHARTS